MPLRIALVGLGQIARNRHLPALAASDEVALAALADPRGGPPEAGLQIHPDHRAMLADPAIDAVAICTPPAARFAIARDALRAGKHVLLEKPPAATLGEAQALLRLAAHHGRTLFATWHSQHNTAVEAARRYLAGKRLATLRIDWNEDFRKYHPDQAWIWQADGLGVFDMGINALSILSRLFATPPFVRAAELRIAENHAAPLTATLHFATLDSDGPMALHMDWAHTGPDQREIRLTTTCGHDLALLDSGGTMLIDGAVTVQEKRAEYPALYGIATHILIRPRPVGLGRYRYRPRMDGMKARVYRYVILANATTG